MSSAGLHNALAPILNPYTTVFNQIDKLANLFVSKDDLFLNNLISDMLQVYNYAILDY